MSDNINPTYYKASPTGEAHIQCIDIAEHLGFLAGNAFKYVWRAGRKNRDKKLDDLRKAEWYLDRLIEKEMDPSPESEKASLIFGLFPVNNTLKEYWVLDAIASGDYEDAQYALSNLIKEAEKEGETSC